MQATRSTRKVRQLAAALALTVCAAAVWARASRANAGRADEVSLYLTVEQGDKLIEGLRQPNFHLYQDGDPRPFRLEPPETPISIALLVEYSQSSYVYLDDIQTAVQGFLDAAPAGNWYALATFSHGLDIQVDFTKQIGKIPAALADLGQPMWDETDTYDAVYAMLDKMGRLPGRRVLIVIGLGADSFSAHSLGDVQKKVESTDVTIYSVGAGSLFRGYYEPYLGSTQRLDLLQAQSFLRMLADYSGGQAWFPNMQAAFPDVMKGIMQSLASQYRLVYDRKAPSGHKFHEIKVEAFQLTDDKRHDFDVRVRKGWRFE